MKQKNAPIQVYEHHSLKISQEIGGLSAPQLHALQMYCGDKGVPYYDLIHNGVRFNQYVGVIQVGKTVIEVLPKADAQYKGEDEKTYWRDILIDMLRAVGVFDIHAPSSTSLKLKSNSILDLYFELFITEVEYLLNCGLVKKYTKAEGNVKALKGSILFGKHLQQNLVHKERFYVRHTVYNTEHLFHQLLYKTILLLRQINSNANLHGRLGALLLNFPEMPDCKVTEATFERLVFNRKTLRYKTSIDIARLLLLQYHPDLSAGKNHVLALMFDMNDLWEQFVYISLSKMRGDGSQVAAQHRKHFWLPRTGWASKIKADIIITAANGTTCVLDTKWKNLNGKNPSPEDLRQMFVYHEYYSANRVALVYPGAEFNRTVGNYANPHTSKATDKECSVFILKVGSSVKKWQQEIYEQVKEWIN